MVRGDLAIGLAAAQAVHAMRQFTAEHPELDRGWFEQSNTVVLLEVPAERDLQALACCAIGCGVAVARFNEPDLNGELTAIAVAPAGARLVSRLPLAFREQAK